MIRLFVSTVVLCALVFGITSCTTREWAAVGAGLLIGAAAVAAPTYYSPAPTYYYVPPAPRSCSTYCSSYHCSTQCY